MTTSWYPVKSNDPPDKRKHCVRWLQMLCHTAGKKSKCKQSITFFPSLPSFLEKRIAKRVEMESKTSITNYSLFLSFYFPKKITLSNIRGVVSTHILQHSYNMHRIQITKHIIMTCTKFIKKSHNSKISIADGAWANAPWDSFSLTSIRHTNTGPTCSQVIVFGK